LFQGGDHGGGVAEGDLSAVFEDLGGAFVICGEGCDVEGEDGGVCVGVKCGGDIEEFCGWSVGD
jgi:hypothetical protein